MPEINLKLISATSSYFYKLSLSHIRYYNQEILDGDNCSIFFITETQEIITPEAQHPIVSLFTVKDTIMRDAVIVIIYLETFQC